MSDMVLTGRRLSQMAADEAAAYFVTHRDGGLHENEQKLLSAWLSADKSHVCAMNRAEAAWRCFDQAGDDEILDQIRAYSRGARAEDGRLQHTGFVQRRARCLWRGTFNLLRRWFGRSQGI
jgi:ferric-dicitrate binding protein FerR (iron transport regulator)